MISMHRPPLRLEAPAVRSGRLDGVLRVVAVALMAVGFWGTVSLAHIGRNMAREPRALVRAELPETCRARRTHRYVGPRIGPARRHHARVMMPLGLARPGQHVAAPIGLATGPGATAW